MQIASLYRSKDLSPVEQIRTTINKIKTVNPQLNALVSVVDDGELLSEAIRSQRRINGGSARSLLDGIAFVVKDNIAVKDLPMTCGSRILADYKANNDATVVRRLRKAGAICIGKANLDEFAMGFVVPSHDARSLHVRTD